MKTKTSILLLLVLFNYHTTTAQVLEQDSLALVAFYNSTGGPNWDNNSNWLTGPVSTWHGVTVEGDRVKELTLYQNNLNGTIPDEVGNLTQIKELKLGHDANLTGEIPESIGNLIELDFFVICNCSIFGTITNNICNCSKLSSLHLWGNNLTGPIPPEIGNLDSLKFLDLHDNQLTGPIPPELGNCTHLWELWLNDNLLTGEIPVELAKLNKVYYLNVSFNQLEGDIPEELANVTSYEDLFFNNNSFTGIPPWADNWFLNALALQNNKMTFEDIEPHFVGYMWFTYSPQDSLGIKIDTVLAPGSIYGIYSGTGGEYTAYHWYRNGELILQSMEADTLWINNISYADTGTYQCWAENSLAIELTLIRRPVHIRLDTGTNIAGFPDQETIKISPNPANEKVTIELPYKAESILVNISDMQGKRIIKKAFKQNSNSQIVLELKELLPGTYILQVQTENKKYLRKIIKNKQGTNR